MINIGTDIQGLSETNRLWNHTNKWTYDFMMESVFQQARTVYALSPTERTTKYQPGGNLLSWEIAAMLAKVVVVGVRRIVAQGAQDLTNYSIL